ncbi:MAG: FtsX-like permease family protein [Chlorobi bacterium]|nr:FtsX-like permease family protein [Chlorobiota bacterium]
MKNKGYSFINIAGLSFGLGLVIIILLLVKYELNYDTNYPDADNIYRVISKGKFGTSRINDAQTPLALSDILQKMPETEMVTRFIPGANKFIRFKSAGFNEKKFFFGDKYIFDIFGLKLISGSLDSLTLPNKVVITENTSKTYFRNTNPLGQTITRGGIKYKIIAVCNDMPPASHFHFDFLASIETTREILGNTYEYKRWKNNLHLRNAYTYIKLKPGTSIRTFEKKLNKIIQQREKHNTAKKSITSKTIKLNFRLQPVKSIHLRLYLTSEMEEGTNPVHLVIYLAIALFILFITGINFINITTLYPTRRLKESSIRKLYGAKRRHIVLLTITEAFIVSAIATLSGLVIAELISPVFNSLFGLNLHITQINGLQDIGIVILITFAAGIISGIYPAKFFSEIKVISIFKKQYNINKSAFILRGTIAAGHLFVVLFLSVLTIGIWNQITYLKDHNPGFDPENIYVINNGFSAHQNFSNLKQELLRLKGVENVSASMSLPGEEYFKMTFNYKSGNKNTKITIPVNHVECDYLETLGLKLKKGTYLNCQMKDSMGIVLNETAIKELKIKKPLESHFEIQTSDGNSWKINIIGVVNDFHFEPLTKKIQPLGMMLLCNSGYFRYITIKLNDSYSGKTLKEIDSIWNKYSDNEPIESFFLSARLKSAYSKDDKMFKAILIFTVFSYFISILGFISLSLFLIEVKKKKIALARTIGISNNNIIRWLTFSFWKFMLVSIAMAVALAYVVLSLWLKNYYYHTTIPTGYYVIAIFAVILTWSVIIIIQYRKTTRTQKPSLFK